MKHLKRFNESKDIYEVDWSNFVPKELDVVKDDEVTSFKVGNIMKHFDMVQVTYSTSEGEIWGYPDTLEFDIYFDKPQSLSRTDKYKILVDITLGNLTVSEFSIYPPSTVSVIEYTSYHSKFDPSNTVFAFTEDSINDLIKFFNKFEGISVERKDLNFLDSDPNSYYPK